MARMMITQYGMSEPLGQVTFVSRGDSAYLETVPGPAKRAVYSEHIVKNEPRLQSDEDRTRERQAASGGESC